MREIEVRELPYLPLGHQGENEAQRIVWRGLADSWARLYGEGVFALTVLRASGRFCRHGRCRDRSAG